MTTDDTNSTQDHRQSMGEALFNAMCSNEHAEGLRKPMQHERASVLSGYLARLDREALSPAGLSDHRRREYLAADNSLRRTLREIGLKGAAEKPPDLHAYIAARAKAEPDEADAAA